MRIAFITPEFTTEPYFSGGLANYLNRVSQALLNEGHEIHVFVSSHQEPRELQENGVFVHRIPAVATVLSKMVNRLTGWRTEGVCGFMDFSWHVAGAVARLHNEKPIDLIQSANSNACGLFTQWRVKVPHVIRISCYRPAWVEAHGVKANLNTKLWMWMEQRSFKKSRHVFGPSYLLADMLAERAGVKGVRVIRTPFTSQEVVEDIRVRDELAKDGPYVLFVGRTQRHKGIYTLADAAANFLAANPDAQLVIAGLDMPGPTGEMCSEYFRRKCSEVFSRVVFTGSLRHDKLNPVVRSARFVVLPSLVDNIPNTMLESMALGRPVLGTVGASFDEIIEDGVTGFLVEKGNAEALADRMNEIWNRDDLDVIGLAAKRKVAEFDDRMVIPQLLDYYKEIIGT